MLRELLQLGLAGVVAGTALDAQVKYAPKPPEPLPPRLGEECVNRLDVAMPGFDPGQDEIHYDGDTMDIAVFGPDGKQKSRWMDVSPQDDTVCVNADGTLTVKAGLVGVGKHGAHGYQPIVWEYSKDGVEVTKGAIERDEDSGWK